MTLLMPMMLFLISTGLRGSEFEPDEAITVLESPGSVDLLYSRGISHLRKKDWKKAVADFTQVIELQPNHVPARYHRATAYQNLGRNDEAIADLDEAAPPRQISTTRDSGESAAGRTGDETEPLPDESSSAIPPPRSRVMRAAIRPCHRTPRTYRHF
ncbi:MAG: tetratricopeptide repeat protein [Planctomycetota bacterium]